MEKGLKCMKGLKPDELAEGRAVSKTCGHTTVSLTRLKGVFGVVAHAGPALVEIMTDALLI